MKTIELRSDTMTTLTPEMRESILTSPFGDWNYNQDPTVIKLQKYAAQLFGCQDAAYVPSATFGNQCAILTISHPGEEMIIRDQSHIIRYQNGSPGRIARVMTKTVSVPFGYLTPQELKKYLRKKKDHQAPKCGILCLQYPSFQGVIPTLESIQQCSKLAIAEGINVHIDGARIFTALAQSKIDPKEIMKYTTTLTICLSKGLLAPMGSIVVGKTKELMAKFKANRKMMGGVFRKPGVIAGSALISLQKMPQYLWKDNEMARILAKRLQELGWVKVVKKVETNMVYYQFTDPRVDGTKLMHYLFQNKVLSWIGNSTNRFVLHHYIRQKEIDIVIQLFQKWRNENVLNEITPTAEKKSQEKKYPEEKDEGEAVKTQAPLAESTQH